MSVYFMVFSLICPQFMQLLFLTQSTLVVLKPVFKVVLNLQLQLHAHTKMINDICSPSLIKSSASG